MASKLPEPLLPQVTQDLERSISADTCHEEEFSCSQVSYGDAVFTSLVVAPLVVSVWRGTWGIMDLNSEMFPFAQIFVLGIIIHACFAILRSHLLARAATQPPSPVSWFRERVVSRLYTYVFILSNIMHWRGGWGLLDGAVAAVIPDASDPHRPVVIAAFLLVFYFCSISLRSSRNILASPYFLVTDGKEATYIFTTRFEINLAVVTATAAPHREVAMPPVNSVLKQLQLQLNID